MKHTIPAILFMIFLSAVASQAQSASTDAGGSSYREVTGLEWLEMSAGERMDQVLAAAYILNKNGIGLSYTIDHYYDAIYQKIQRNPTLYTSNLTDILANYVYEKEAQSRTALDRLREKSGVIRP